MTGTSGSSRAVELAPGRILAATFLLALVAYLLFLLSRWLAPGEWEFALEVETDVASVELRGEALTQWRVDGAVLCTAGAIDLPDTYRLHDAREICGGRRWSGWRLDLPEQVLTLTGGTTAMLVSADDRLAMTLRTDAASLGEFAVVGAVDPVILGDSLNLFWPLPAAGRSLTFPFTGATTLGRAVSWSQPGMLHSGSVTVFTADESADRRTRVDEAALMLGDQVRLVGDAGENLWPKGFLSLSDSGALAAVAFGRADSLSIDRYGESGYDFRPGFLARLAGDPLIAFWGSMLVAYMTVIFSLVPFLDERPVSREDMAGRTRLLRLLMRYKNP